jgi:hypothetical protein
MIFSSRDFFVECFLNVSCSKVKTASCWNLVKEKILDRAGYPGVFAYLVRLKVSVPQGMKMEVLLALLPSHPANGKIAAYIIASLSQKYSGPLNKPRKRKEN